MRTDRVQYFFRARVSEARPSPADVAGSIQAYVEPPCVNNLMATGTIAIVRRVEAIRRIAPSVDISD